MTNMKFGDSLTIVLTLKNRHSFTKRWLLWAEHEQCPFKILIADGSDDDEIEKHLQTCNYKNLKIDYIRYEPDINLGSYFSKMADVHSKVETEFVVHADNDDFILFKSLLDSLSVAHRRSDIVCISTPHYRFKIDTEGNKIDDHLAPGKNDVYIRKLPWQHDFENLLSTSPIERLHYSIENFKSAWFWYGIHRSSNLKRIHSNVVKLGFSQAMFQEWYLIYSVSVAGKCLFLDHHPFLVRQERTSSGAISLYEAERLDRIFLYPDWSANFTSLTSQLYREYLECAGGQADLSCDEFKSSFIQLFSQFLSSWNQFRGMADKYRSRKYIFNLFRHLYLIYNGSFKLWGTYRKIEKFRKDKELASLQKFLHSFPERISN